MTFAAGVRLGPYEILGPLGAGGMGEVYRAKDAKLGREVAVKVLPESVSADPERLARFEREARSLASVNHPNIVTIYAVEEAGGVRLLAMELVEGRTLDAVIPTGGLPLSPFFAIAVPLSDALSAAHERGIIHRDLKPGNVMLTDDGRVKVLDFGLAKLDAPASDPNLTDVPTESRVALTGKGEVFGTVAYMSPEQARGGRIDTRSDVFSLGILLYEMLTGDRPFKGASSVDLISSILRDQPPPVTEVRSDLPPHIGRVLRRCLEKNPRDRYQTSRDVFNELRELQAETSAVSPLPRPMAGDGDRPRSGATDGRTDSKAFPVSASAGKRTTWAAAAAAILLGLSVYLFTRSKAAHPPSPAPASGAEPRVIRSIAVLPLDNYSGDASQDYFAEGMTDELTTDLATISRLRVISRGSTTQFKGAHRPPTPEIARKLDVDAIVEGSVLRSGDRVRITAQLIDARADRHLWAKSFERSSRDVLALQDELASSIAREIHVQLSPTESSRLTSAPSVDPAAYDAYLKGRYFFNRPSDESLTKAIGMFEESVRLSPGFTPAYSGLSDAYLWAGYNEGPLTSAQARPKARLAAEKAIELDDQSAEAHTSLANYKFFYERDWTGCEREFRRATALNPNYAFAHDQFGLALALLGRIDEAIAEGKRAAELDPLSPQIPLDAAIAFMFRRDFSAARELARKSAELDPTFFFAPYVDGWIDIDAGDPAKGLPALKKAKALGAPEFVSAWLGYASGASGDRASALAELEDMKKTSRRGEPLPFNQALVYLGLGDRSRAISELERASAADSQFIPWLKMDRIFDPLRAEPRFVALMKALKLDR